MLAKTCWTRHCGGGGASCVEALNTMLDAEGDWLPKIKDTRLVIQSQEALILHQRTRYAS